MPMASIGFWCLPAAAASCSTLWWKTDPEFVIDKDIDNKLLISVAGRLFEAGELTTGCWHYFIDVQFRSSQEPHHPQPLRARYPQGPTAAQSSRHRFLGGSDTPHRRGCTSGYVSG
jgi:hypothetical protein